MNEWSLVMLDTALRENIAILLLLISVVPIFILMVYAIVRSILNRGKEEAKRQQAIGDLSIDQAQQELFNNAFGGTDNIVSVEIVMSRLTITIVDMEKVQSEQLKELGATSVLLVGNQVKVAFGDRSNYVYQMIKK